MNTLLTNDQIKVRTPPRFMGGRDNWPIYRTPIQHKYSAGCCGSEECLHLGGRGNITGPVEYMPTPESIQEYKSMRVQAVYRGELEAFLARFPLQDER